MPFLHELTGTLFTPSSGRSRRVSSNEQPNWNDGNFDQTWLKPGDVLEMPRLIGPGMINHMWFTSHAGGVGELDALTLRIWWDDRPDPAVEVPMSMFFAVGQGRPAVVESLIVQVSSTGSLTCYWPMPFAKSARITITNDNPDRAAGLYWQIDYVELESLPPDTAYFHARYRQEYPAEMGRDYLIADIEGSGKYVGTVMAVTMAQDGWFGEGDDYFFIDGEEIPSLQGTGSEDYFNDAWGFRERTSTWFGQPRWQGWRAGDEGVCYRWHILDSVHFKESLKVAIEHKGNQDRSEDSWYIERPDYFSSVAFWYQTGIPKPFGELPNWSDRRVPWIRRNLVRSLRKTETNGSPPAVRTTGMFGGLPVLFWNNDTPGASLNVPFAVDEDGRYAVRLSAFPIGSYASFVIIIDGVLGVESCVIEPSGEVENDILLGVFELSGGNHTLTFLAANSPELTGAIAVETLRFLKLPKEAMRTIKNDNEAHFIRLGIGRAIYAYKLAYDEMPVSLEQLVEEGIMEERYLLDENSIPLNAWLEDGTFFAESVGPGKWKSSWRGLDARR